MSQPNSTTLDAPKIGRRPAFVLGKTLLIGTLGGALFYYFQLPLAWMIGAMVLTTVASLSRVELRVPHQMRAIMITILGVLLGSTFSGELLDKATEWPLTIASLALYLAVVTGLLYLYFYRVAGYDPVTAYFSATPGGMSEMLIAGKALGGDERTIALVHAARVLLVVMIIPFWFRYNHGDAAVTSTPSPVGAALNLLDVAVLLACAVLGVIIGKLLRLPAYQLVGPMLLSAMAHIAGITHSAPPWQLVAIAQVVVGSYVGARFSGVPVGRVLKTLGGSIGSTSVMLALTFSFAWILVPLTDLDYEPLVLAFSPGGLAEMSLIALALSIETAFVATHHVIRIALIMIGAPLMFKLVRRR